MEKVLDKSVELIKGVLAQRHDARNTMSSNSRLYSHPAEYFAGMDSNEIKKELLAVRHKKSKLSARLRGFLDATLVQAALVLVQEQSEVDEQIIEGE